MRIFHIATAADWQQARRSGSYTTSTRGRSLAQEGFLHASRREQVAGVFRAYYADADEPLVLLSIETDRLGVPWREDPVGDDTFPHVYGPLSPRAVVDVQPLDRHGRTPSFSRLFFEEMFLRLGLGVVAMVLTVGGAAVGGGLLGGLGTAWGQLLGAAVGLAVGLTLLVVVLRRRGR